MRLIRFLKNPVRYYREGRLARAIYKYLATGKTEDWAEAMRKAKALNHKGFWVKL